MITRTVEDTVSRIPERVALGTTLENMEGMEKGVKWTMDQWRTGLLMERDPHR